MDASGDINSSHAPAGLHVGAAGTPAPLTAGVPSATSPGIGAPGVRTLADAKADLIGQQQAAEGTLGAGDADENAHKAAAKDHAQDVKSHTKETASQGVAAAKEGAANTAGKAGAAVKGMGAKITHMAEQVKAK
eukprot:SM000024S07793  [mRNA]  locus=s24:519372:520300:+ [translate_table: standard]